jgi:hypothetical protein
MTETNSSLYWIGGIGSGVFITALSATAMWFLENKKPTAKTVGRDFILGAILFFILLQLVPESMMTLLGGAIALVPTMSGGSAPEVIENVIETLTSTVAASDEVEVRVGVPRF